MFFIELNDGTTINLLHISSIKLDDKKVLYEPAKGSLNAIEEIFDTAALAQARYNELKELCTK